MWRSPLLCVPFSLWALNFINVPAVTLLPSCCPGHSHWKTNWGTLCFSPYSWITFKTYLGVRMDITSSVLLKLHVWGQRWGEHLGKQFHRLHENCPANFYFSELAYICSSWGKDAEFHESTLAFHCVFDELCPVFCLKVSSQRTGCAITRA